MASEVEVFFEAEYKGRDTNYMLISSESDLARLRERSDDFVCIVHSEAAWYEDDSTCRFYEIKTLSFDLKSRSASDAESSRALDWLAKIVPATENYPHKKFYIISYTAHAEKNVEIELRIIKAFSPKISTFVKRRP